MTAVARYYVSRCEGSGRSSYSVLDRYTCHRAVAMFYPDNNTPHGDARHERQAVAECARLNALDAE